MRNLKFSTKETTYLNNNDLFRINSAVVSINPAEVHSELSQASSRMEIFAKIFSTFQPVTVQPLTALYKAPSKTFDWVLNTFLSPVIE